MAGRWCLKASTRATHSECEPLFSLKIFPPCSGGMRIQIARTAKWLAIRPPHALLFHYAKFIFLNLSSKTHTVAAAAPILAIPFQTPRT